MNLRQHLALLVYDIKTGGCLVPFKDQGDGMRADVYERVDQLLGILDCDPGHDVTAAVVKPGEGRIGAVNTYRKMIKAIARLK